MEKKRRLQQQPKQHKTKRSVNKYDDIIESDGDMSDLAEGTNDGSVQSSSSRDNDSSMDNSDEDSEEERETAGAKKIRLAREYLSKMEEAEDDDSEDDDSEDDESCSTAASDVQTHDKIGTRLARERLRHHGMLERKLADDVAAGVGLRWDEYEAAAAEGGAVDKPEDAESRAREWTRRGHVKLCRGHDLTCTSVALDNSNGGATAYSASKDNSILMWDVQRQLKTHTITPRWDKNESQFTRNSGEILTMAASDDGRYLAVGGRDATVKIYDVRHKTTPQPAATLHAETSSAKSSSTPTIKGLVHTFTGHKGPITALTFRHNSPQLFSGSTDRCIRHYNVQELSYIETLYGHQAAVSSIACYGVLAEMPISVARDRTARAWKITEDTHLIFRGGGRVASADCVAALRDDWFLTGHEDGLLALWVAGKKRAVVSVKESHGESNGLGRGVACCAVLGETDLALTGSNDGYIRVWKANTGVSSAERGLTPMQKIPVHGYVNDIAIGPNGKFCVAAVGQEPRLGRWDRVPRAKNRFAIIQLQKDTDDEEGSNDSHHHEDNDDDDVEVEHASLKEEEHS